MSTTLKAQTINTIKQIFTFKWKPTIDLAIVALSWILVTGSLALANYVFTPARGGLYFVFYCVIGAFIFGIGLPIFWMVKVKKRPVADLGFTKKWWLASIIIQIVLATIQYFLTLYKTPILDIKTFLPLLSLALCIGFFEAIFWRGWVLLRLEESFGIIPAIIVGSVLYAAYHIGYGMNFTEMRFLFFIGIIFAVIFRFTKNVFILWPLLQPMGQLVTFIKDKLSLPMIAILGFLEVLLAMIILFIMVDKYYKKRLSKIKV